jgi:hypothetical protein
MTPKNLTEGEPVSSLPTVRVVDIDRSPPHRIRHAVSV